jgi:hypothetical protein
VEWEEEKNMGEVLSRLYRSPAGKLPVVIPKGRIRPVLAIIAAKFATECYKTIKNHVHVRSHWRKYRGTLGSSLTITTELG